MFVFKCQPYIDNVDNHMAHIVNLPINAIILPTKRIGSSSTLGWRIFKTFFVSICRHLVICLHRENTICLTNKSLGSSKKFLTSFNINIMRRNHGESCFQRVHIVASELKDPICHSNECQIGFFSSEATTCLQIIAVYFNTESQYCTCTCIYKIYYKMDC